MADFYLKSSATGAANGTSWTDAFTTLSSAVAAASTDDTIFVSSNHEEGPASGGFSLSFPNPPKHVISVNDSAMPPTQQETGAQFFTTTSAQLIIGVGASIDGLVLETTRNGAPTAGPELSFSSSTNGGALYIKNVKARMLAARSYAVIAFGSNASSQRGSYQFINSTVRFNQSTQRVRVNNAYLLWDGGGVEDGGVDITGLFSSSGACNVDCRNLDLTALPVTADLMSSTTWSGTIVFQNCKLPAGWVGSLAVTPTTDASRVSMYNCDSGDTNYRMMIVTFAGQIRSETSSVHVGGATDGTTPLSWALVANANAKEIVAPLVTDPTSMWNEDVGTPKTLTIEIAQEGGTVLTNAEIWLEVTYPGDATTLGFKADNKRLTLMATPATHAASTVEWAGLTSPTKQKLQVTFTPQQKGPIYATVYLGKPNTTVFVCPKPELT